MMALPSGLSARYSTSSTEAPVAVTAVAFAVVGAGAEVTVGVEPLGAVRRALVQGHWIPDGPRSRS